MPGELKSRRKSFHSFKKISEKLWNMYNFTPKKTTQKKLGLLCIESTCIWLCQTLAIFTMWVYGEILCFLANPTDVLFLITIKKCWHISCKFQFEMKGIKKLSSQIVWQTNMRRTVVCLLPYLRYGQTEASWWAIFYNYMVLTAISMATIFLSYSSFIVAWSVCNNKLKKRNNKFYRATVKK